MPDNVQTGPGGFLRDPRALAGLNEPVLSSRRGAPWDGKLVGVLEFAYAGLSFWLAIGFFQGVTKLADDPGWVPLVLFGAIRLKSEFWCGIASVCYGCVLAIAGYGMLRARPFGWWASLLVFLDHIPRTVASAAETPDWKLAISSAIILSWLVYRVWAYHPFRWIAWFRGLRRQPEA